MGKKIVIVGGVAGGATAAARLRRLDESAEIVVIERTGYVSYANCGLPYYVGGVIEDTEELTLQSPQSFKARFNIDVRVSSEVTAIDRAGKCVTVRNLADGSEYTESYDKLLLAPGAKAIRPQLPGLDDPRVRTLRTVEDALALRQAALGAQRAVVIGGGFIGLEAAENLVHAGLEVSLCEAAPQVLPTLDADMALLLQAELVKNGVALHLGQALAGFAPAPDGLACLLADGTQLTADLAVLAVGVAPDSALAAQAGLETAARGAIVVDEAMRTSDPDIYAVGDAVQIRHAVTGAPARIALAGPAAKQGRIAADNIAGGSSRYRGAQGTSILRLFGLTAASTGLGERQCREAGLDCDSVILSPATHASYYPGGTVLTMKVLFCPATGRLLGAQVVGEDGVDKRIDVLATALRAGLTGPELAELDLAYAPPFSSAKDPVNLAGYLIENVLLGRMAQTHYEDLPACGEMTKLDVRTAEEYAAGHAAGFQNIPLDSLRERLSELPQDRPVLVMCQSGLRSYLACRLLAGHGYRCRNFAGGYRYYRLRAQAGPGSRTAAPCGREEP